MPRSALRALSTSAASHLASFPHVNLALTKTTKAPIAVRNIYCIGRNYVAHALELGNKVPTEEPVIFTKSSASLRGLEGGELAFADETFHFEAELVLLLGPAHVPLGALTAGREADCVQGYGLGLDLTRRAKQSELKKGGLPWTVSKSFSGSAIVSEMRILDEPGQLQHIEFGLSVNGEERQRGHVNQMIFDIPFQLRYLNSLTSLLPGDLVFTGTPQGVGECRRGDQIALRYFDREGLVERTYKGVL